MIFLEAAVRAGLNILVAGGTSSGKTTLLNVLSSFIPHDERIITIEDAAELQLQQVHVIPLESRPATVRAAERRRHPRPGGELLRMRPDRIVVGECRDKEALDMLQAMNTGHDGCMTTVHSNSPRDALSRIETMVADGERRPTAAARSASRSPSAFDLIVYMERLEDGVAQGDVHHRDPGLRARHGLAAKHLPTRRRPTGQRMSELLPTGIRPQVMRKLEKSRIFLAPDFFQPPPELVTTSHRIGR